MCARSRISWISIGKTRLSSLVLAGLLILAHPEDAEALSFRGPRRGGSTSGFQLLAGVRGFYQNSFFETSSDNTGATGFLGSFYAQAHLTARFAFGGWGISPLIAYTPLARKDSDGGVSKTVGNLGINAEINMGTFDLKTGPGIMMVRYSGDGGSVELDNGGGTSTFFHPSRTSTATTTYWNLGVGWWLAKDWRMDTDLLVHSPMSERRSGSIQVSVGYQLL